MLRTAHNFSNSTYRVPTHSSRHQTSASLAGFLLKREQNSPLSCSSLLIVGKPNEWICGSTVPLARTTNEYTGRTSRDSLIDYKHRSVLANRLGCWLVLSQSSAVSAVIVLQRENSELSYYFTTFLVQLLNACDWKVIISAKIMIITENWIKLECIYRT